MPAEGFTFEASTVSVGLGRCDAVRRSASAAATARRAAITSRLQFESRFSATKRDSGGSGGSAHSSSAACAGEDSAHGTRIPTASQGMMHLMHGGETGKWKRMLRLQPCVKPSPFFRQWSYDLRTMRVLIVEDDPILANGLTETLRREGFVTDAVTSAE